MAAQSRVNSSFWWSALAALLVTGGLIYLLAPVLAPFLIAAAFAYVCDPLVNRLQQWRLNRTLAVTVVFAMVALVLTLVLILVLPLLQQQIALLLQRIPQVIDWIETGLLPWLQQTFDVSPEAFDVNAAKTYLAENWQGAGGIVTSVLGAVSRSGMTLIGWLANLLLIPVVAFYLMCDWHTLLAWIRGSIPPRLEPEVVRLARASDDVLGAFLRGQILVMLALGVIYSLGLWIVGLDLAFLIGMISGLLSFVPYLGFIVGIAAASVAAFMQFQELMPVLYVFVAFGVAQAIEGTLLTPWLLGNRIGMHPVAVIFAVLAGGQLFGFVGILLAVPVAAVLLVLLRYAHERYLQSSLYETPTGE